MSAAVESRPSNTSMEVEENSSEQPVSRFTAVNGRSPSNSSPNSKDPSPNPEQDKQKSSASQEDSSTHEINHSRASSSAMNRPESPSNASKRKRSDSGDQPSESKRRSSPSQAYSHSTSTVTNGTSEEHGSNQSQQDGYRNSREETSERYAESHEQSWQHREGDLTTDAQLAEALTRETQQQTPSSQMDTSPPQHFSPMSSQQQTPSGPPPPPTPGRPQLGPGITAPMLQKQRKRNFSNRTKTGCLTCRERKKKCDEGKPTCMNCQRGGFQCKGYSQGNSLYKATRLAGPEQPPPPLQAKNGIYERGGPPPYPARHMPGPEYYDGPPPPGGARMEGVRTGRRPFEEDPRERLTIPNPQDPNIRTNVARYQPADPYFNQHPPPPPELLPRQEYASMAQHQHQHLPNMTTHEQMARDQKALPPPQPVHPTAHTSTMGSIAQSALDHPSSRPPPGPPPPSNYPEYRSEKEKMLGGVPFSSKDPQLKRERQDCAKAVYRFNNNAVNPDNLSESAKIEQFRQIVESRRRDSGSPSTTGSPGGPEKAFGRVGKDVEVEAPFYCDYGYNIRIGNEVEIGPDCRIMDSSQVEIGDRTIICPDVKIITLDGDHKPVRAPGAKRLLKAKRIVIGKDCFIGAGAILLPGITIPDGSTIGAGTVVPKSLPGPFIATSHHNELRYLSSAWGHPPSI